MSLMYTGRRGTVFVSTTDLAGTKTLVITTVNTMLGTPLTTQQTTQLTNYLNAHLTIYSGSVAPVNTVTQTQFATAAAVDYIEFSTGGGDRRGGWGKWIIGGVMLLILFVYLKDIHRGRRKPY